MTYRHPFLVLLAAVALVATLTVVGVAWTATIVHDNNLRRDANCPAIGEVWNSDRDECVTDTGVTV